MTLPTPTNLRVDHLAAPLGMTTRDPRLCWQLPDGAAVQVAYRIRGTAGTTDWDTGRVESDRHLFVPYGGPPLASRERTTWAVKVWTDAGESPWSEVGSWETGLLEPSDWIVSWIRPDEGDTIPPAGLRPAYHLRGDLVVERPVIRARVYATAHGIYELFLNGERLGDAELTPGHTAYRDHLQVQTYDVTELVRVGANTLGAILSDGWYRGRTCYHRLPDGYGERTALLAQLVVDHDDGTTTVSGTGTHWQSALGAIKAADLFDGQDTDLRDDLPGWSSPGTARDGWTPVRTADSTTAELVSSPSPPVRRIQEVRPVSITCLSADRQVIDFGQNLHGWVRLSNLGPRGTSLLLTHAEALDATGDVNVASAAGVLGWYEPPRGVQTDRVISAGRAGEAFEPRHTRHGFQYLRVQGHPETLTVDDVVAVVVDSDLPRVGWLRTSDERLNRLYEIAFWTIRNAECDTPTTEISREWAGWTDWVFTSPSAALLHDISGFTVKWLRDLAADQWPDGKIRNYAPDPLGPGSLTARFAVPQGFSGWGGDASVGVPWQIWRSYGDPRVLAEQYDSMVRWIEYVRRQAQDHRHASRIAARAEPAPHERFLWDTGYHWAEDMAPERGDIDSGEFEIPPEEFPSIEAFAAAVMQKVEERDDTDFATAHFHNSTRLLARIARILGHDEDAEKYHRLADDIRAAWQTEFIGPDGALTIDEQPTHVRALAFDLVPDELRARTAGRLAELIREAGTHASTGLPTTPILLPALAENGHIDVAYDLLLEKSAPSWWTVIDRGGTTFWEHWEGIAADGSTMRSLNLPTRATLVAFLHTYTAGVRIIDDSPGYRRFRVAPQPGAGLTWVESQLDSPYGRIESSWRIEQGTFSLTVVVPPGTTAEVVLPDGTREDAGPGTATFSSPLP